MSRGFVREEDQEETPIVPPRADLPEGVTNYVTPSGWQLLQDEKREMQESIGKINATSEQEKRIATNFIHAKLQLLNNRIASAKVVDLSEQPKDVIRFGARITLKIDGQKKPQKYQLVGVDEANIAQKKISFLSPIARILTDKKVGETATLKLAKGERNFEVLAIEYPK